MSQIVGMPTFAAHRVQQVPPHVGMLASIQLLEQCPILASGLFFRLVALFRRPEPHVARISCTVRTAGGVPHPAVPVSTTMADTELPRRVTDTALLPDSANRRIVRISSSRW
ncbi:hypothetical protein [Nocardia carnea]|uniref:hypothetical protein n=1 Tax=Nocardia carnea TaxID=37328 RepID=UPI001E296898|nr:hypothetical protein [Nocardia carnea]